jgi:plasmid stabilization system protein ParE
MRRFRVIVSPAAERDIEGSYLWERKHWGRERANHWVRELRTAIYKLGSLPESRPLAPESHEFPQPIHQILVGRYRVLSAVADRKVLFVVERALHGTF